MPGNQPPAHVPLFFTDARRFRESIAKTRLFKSIENFTTKNWKFSDKTSDTFHISAQNVDWGYTLEPPGRGGFNECPQSMFLSRNKKTNVYPCKPQFYYKKVGGLRGSKLYRHVSVMRTPVEDYRESFRSNWQSMVKKCQVKSSRVKFF